MRGDVVDVTRRGAIGWPAGWGLALGGLASLTAAAFALAPGDLPAKAQAVLHGLCAQRPAHTFLLGGTPLPFDARMTGLYLGAAVAALPLVWGRRRGSALGWRWLALLAAFVAVMALDGVNSLRVDLGLAAWWSPSNELRLGTGLLAGLSLGVALVWLLNLALWPAAGGAALLRARDIAGWTVGTGAAGGLVLSAADWAWTPLALALLVSAVLVLLALNLAVLSLLGAARPVARTATLALALALLEMALLAGGRYALEWAVGSGQWAMGSGRATWLLARAQLAEPSLASSLPMPLGSPPQPAVHCPLPTAHCPLVASGMDGVAL